MYKLHRAGGVEFTYYYRPKIMTCLDLVRNGTLSVEDAVATFEEWGFNEDAIEGKSETIEDEPAGEEKPSGETAGGDDGGGVNLDFIAQLLPGLGLVQPPIGLEGDATNEAAPDNANLQALIKSIMSGIAQNGGGLGDLGSLFRRSSGRKCRT